jgi:Domain of unknown function (DUF4340)
MNRKQFLILVLALIVLGGAGLALFWQDIAAYRASGAKIGARLLPQFKLADVAQVHLRDAKQEVTLLRKDTGWVVKERRGYPASFQEISDLLVKLAELKVTQSEQIGASLLARVELNEPGKGEGAGTLIEFKDMQEKPLARLVLGKKILKKDPLNPLPTAVDGVPAGRYVLRPDAKETIAVVVSDPLNSADANPGRWLQKDFFKIERIKTLTVTTESGNGWKITRNEEWGQWKFASGGGDLAAGAAVAAVNALGSLSFTDVLVDDKPEDTENRYTIVAETFDDLTYTVKIAKRKSGENFLLNASISGEPPKTRVPDKDEKAEQKERRDKDFEETRKRLELRLAREKAQSAWTYVVARKEVEPLLRDRADLIARKRDKDDKGPPGMPRFPF